MVNKFVNLKRLFVFLLALFAAEGVSAQQTDTLTLSLPEAEKLFVQNNHQLIAVQYQIDQARADVITARLFDNPELSYENLLYNKETKRFLEISRATGQYQASLSQMIKLAGKRNKNIQLANIGVKLADYQYFDLIRTLKYTLHTTFYKAYYEQQSAAVYAQQISSLKLLLQANEAQLKLGNVAAKEVIRIKSLLYTLQTEYSMSLNEIEDLQSEIKLMTGLKPAAALKLVTDPQEQLHFKPEQRSYIGLLDTARNNRADLQLARSEVTYAEKNLSLQKANAVPDVELSLSYDLKGSYPDNYTGIGLRVPLPLFNRNQGEIKKAKIAIAAGNVALKQQEAVLESEVHNSYVSALRTESLYQGMDTQFNSDFDKLITEVIKNFRSRNISLMEFLDFYDSYKENTLQMNNLKFERMKAKEELNFVTGSNIFK